MRFLVGFNDTKINTLGNIQNELKILLNENLAFRFNYVQVSEYEESEGRISCGAIEAKQDGLEEIVTYPDFCSKEPVSQGTTELVISINGETFIDSDVVFVDPTWKQLLQEINNILKNTNLEGLILYGIVAIGLSKDGMGYKIEASVIKPNFFN